MGPSAAKNPGSAVVIEQSSLRDQVGHSLRSALISGRMVAGELYSAPSLAEMLGVSPTPVREAMLDLVREGLVKVERNKGFRVMESTIREIEETAELMALIEVPILCKIARQYAGESSDQLRHLLESASVLKAMAEKGERIDYLRGDIEFHTDFLRRYGNQELARVVHDLRLRNLVWTARQSFDDNELVRDADEHFRMIDAALRGDEPEMKALAESHHLVIGSTARSNPSSS